jgi:hypothetical protein
MKEEPFEETYIFTTSGLPPIVAKKVVNLVNILNTSVINISRLKVSFAEGIPD